jgi:NAD(P)-dependent dehydrogenase (short-subunit alcohol dehydrogenase family)
VVVAWHAGQGSQGKPGEQRACPDAGGADPGAAVINVSAPQAFLPMALQSHVCAAKAGVDMLTRVLAIEWGPDGIRVNAVVPGPIAQTEGMARLAPTAEAVEMIRRTVPIARLGTPGDPASACLLLASPLAGYITGAVLPVAGGWALGGASQAMGELAQGRGGAGPAG